MKNIKFTATIWVYVFMFAGLSFLVSAIEPILVSGDDPKTLEALAGFILIGFSYLFVLMGNKGRN